ncbi:MAG: lipopolysaccharide transport periplasmic protein LptA [Nitrospinota bacterium]|nr:lipopolysaccharide transport periplasmic protein LptA [Nitrospinota bacterium]
MITSKMAIILFFSLVSLNCYNSTIYANDENVPTRITSEKMEVDNKKNIIIFTGNVFATKGRIEIRADKLVLHPDKKNIKGSETLGKSNLLGTGKMQKIIATGNVLLNQDRIKYASGDKLDFDDKRRIAILTGNAKAWEGKNQVIGDKIVMFLNEDKTIVHGSKHKRVHVTLHPKQQK